MNRKIYSTLVNAVENMTQEELFHAPELSTLVALDANLLAALDMLELRNPSTAYVRSGIRRMEDGVDVQIAASIRILAAALRDNLSAYYAVIKENCNDDTDQEEIAF